MGTELTGQCSCGYKGKVYIGSGRAEHGKLFKFPHYCGSCNSLTSVDMLGEEIKCAECGSPEIYSYAAPTKTLAYNSLLNRLPLEMLKKAGYHKSEAVHDESFCYPIKKSFPFLRGNHFCPRCKEQSMTFFTSMLYD